MELGNDPDEILEQTADFVKKAAALGVPLGFTPKPLKTNPAALEAEKP